MKKIILILMPCLFSSCITIYIKYPEKQENKELELYSDSLIICNEKELNCSDSERLNKLRKAADEVNRKIKDE